MRTNANKKTNLGSIGAPVTRANLGAVPERDPSASGLPHRGESDGVDDGLLGEKRVHGSGTPENTTGQGGFTK